MLKLNKNVEYALISLIEMGNTRRVYSARELSHRFQIPFGLLSKILQRLANKELVCSIQGPKGGYILERSTNEITMDEVLTAVHGSLNMVPCMDEDRDCEQRVNCNIKRSVGQVQTLFLGFLGSLTLKEFTELNMSGKNPRQLSLKDPSN